MSIGCVDKNSFRLLNMFSVVSFFVGKLVVYKGFEGRFVCNVKMNIYVKIKIGHANDDLIFMIKNEKAVYFESSIR